MRSFEIPAIGGCMLVEDTDEHRALFGPPGEAATYFKGVPAMVAQLVHLLSVDEERSRLAAAAHQRICDGNHTYDDRLLTMLTAVPA